MSFVATDSSGYQVMLGTGFLLYGNGRMGLFATAAHVVDEASKVQRPRRAGAGVVDPDAGGSGHRPEASVEPENMRLLWHRQPFAPEMLVIKMVVQANGADVALLWATFQDASPADLQFPMGGFAVDHRMPAVGSEVMALGMFDQAVTQQSVAGDRRSVEMKLRVGVRRGSVTAVDLDGRYLGMGPNFESTMPFPAGLSGSPVFDAVDGGQAMVVRGLVSSSGFSPSEAYSDTAVAGAGRAVSVGSLLRLPIDGTKSRALMDLVRFGEIEDASGLIDRIDPESETLTLHLKN